ncbi:primosomal protein N' [candidate division WOR-3 bacterium]|uniref:Replication restart protein PriA n=1 Tax=candidate division WOR-3 bacterium TaxID=2052148 RepID=A0A660SMU2_UNCW3|nr:MAG: primosomal protein N' [candidate division WOR-3 bacterium]
MESVKVVPLGKPIPPLSYLTERAAPGDLVLVPIRDRVAYGLVIGVGSESRRLRRIRRIVIKRFIPEDLLRTIFWMADYYLAPIDVAIRMAIPRLILPRTAFPSLIREYGEGPVPNRWQRHAIDKIGAAIKSRTHQIFLLYGVTGSGKTEVYINLIQKALRMGMGAIFLYPEIGLTPLYRDRFQRRFPSLVLHSGLNQKTRRSHWHALREGVFPVGIGPRSAIFAPIPKLGLIIVDEEHSTSYKEEFRPPRYHAREVAIARGRFASCPVVLGSATPAVETYYHAVCGRIHLIRLPQRVKHRPLPVVRLVDLRRVKQQPITPCLKRELDRSVSRGEQAIIFINRKGYAPVLICPECGFTPRCPGCDIPLVYYRKEEILRCPYCNYNEPIGPVCPRCHHPRWRMIGMGTERIEEQLRRLFGDKVVRFDRSRVIRDLERIYLQFQNRDRLLMVGTSLVTKGHDFPKVTLVGVINGDQILNLPDFRAGEYTFQVLTQVAGRAGRGRRPGRVIIQTHRPDHPIFQSIKEQSYERFYQEEIIRRKELGYPPFSRLILIRLRGPSLPELLRIGIEIKNKIPEILGPVPSFRRKIGGNHQLIMLLKVDGKDGRLKDLIGKDSRLAVDVDPITTI